MTTTNRTDSTGGERWTRRQMIAGLALATDLPAPFSISFTGDNLVCLHLDTIADGLVWAARLGVAATVDDHGDGASHLWTDKNPTWHGWSVLLYASQPNTADQSLDQDTQDRLAELAGGAA